MQYNYSKKMFTRRALPIRIIGDPDNKRSDKRSSYCMLKLALFKRLTSFVVAVLHGALVCDIAGIRA